MNKQTKQKQKQKNNNKPLGFRVSTKKVQIPNAYGSVQSITSRNSIRVKHTVNLGLFDGSTSFGQIAQFTIQPNDIPWIKNIASNYEYYEIHSFDFSFLPSVGSSATGAVYSYWDVDVHDAPLESIDQIMSCKYSASANTWLPHHLKVTNKRDLNPNGRRFNKSAGYSIYTDTRLYNAGIIRVFNHGNVSSTIGSFTLDLDITFSNPQVELPYGGHVTGIPNVTSGVNTAPDVLDVDGRVDAYVAAPTSKQVADGAISGAQVVNLARKMAIIASTKCTGTGLTPGCMLAVAGSALNQVYGPSAVNAAGSIHTSTTKLEVTDDGDPDLRWFQMQGDTGLYTTATEFSSNLSLADYGNIDL